MCHRTRGRHAVDHIADGAGGRAATADIRGACAEDRALRALCAAGAEFGNGTSFCSADDAVCLRRDERLQVDGQEHKGLDDLCLDDRGTDGQDRLTRENGGTLTHCPDIAREAEGAQVLQKRFAEEILFAQERDVILGEAKVLDVVDDLLKTGKNGKTATVGNGAEEDIKIGDLITATHLEIAICHGELVKVAK